MSAPEYRHHTTGGICTVPDCDVIVADAYVCATCAHRTRVALDDVGGLTAELDITLAKQDRRGDAVGRPASEIPLPYNVSASIVRDALTSTLRTWALVLAGDVLGTMPATTPDQLADHLADHIERIRHHPDGGSLVDEVSAAVGAARDEIFGPTRHAMILAGHCPRCGVAVYARQGVGQARCRREGCAGVVDADAWREQALVRLDAMALPAAEAARVLTALGTPVEAALVRQWAHRGQLTPVDQDARGRPTYRVADVRHLLTPAENRERIAP